MKTTVVLSILLCTVAAWAGPAAPADSPFADGLTTAEAAPATERDTEAAPDALVPPGWRLQIGMTPLQARLARPGLRQDGEGGRPDRAMLSARVPECEGGGDIGAVFAEGRLESVFRGWSGEYAFSATNPGPARDDLRDAFERLGAPSLRRTVATGDGFRHYWAWTKGDHALVFEFTRKTEPEDEVRAVVAVERRGVEDEETLWNLAAGTF